MNKLVVHFSKTPVAGAPMRLADATNAYTKYRAVSFVEEDYKGEKAGIFRGSSVYIDKEASGLCRVLLDESLREASIFHIHNLISRPLATMLREKYSHIPTIYHLHSPLREGPLYVSRQGELQRSVAKTLVVAQAHPRFFPQATAVPNIVPCPPSPISGRDDRKVRVLYAPVQMGFGRWNGKGSADLSAVLEELKYDKDVELISLDKPSPSHVLEKIRSICDITIDEITTGAFHQISIEGLHAGSAVVNGADFVSMQAMIGWAGARPPFVISSPKNVRRDILALVRNHDFREEVRSKSRSFAEKYLQPERLIKIYEAIYDEIH